MTITRRLVVGLLALLVTAGYATAQDTGAAEKAATEWLAHIDAGRYAESWTLASTTFRQAVTQEKWQEAATMARDRVGAFKSRTRTAAMPKSNPQGAPAGEYVIFQYSAVFEKHATAIETVSTTRDADGTWRVVGYFVR